MIVIKDIAEILTLSSAAQKNARNITVQDLSVISSAALVIEKKKIAWVGEQRKLPAKYKKYKKVSMKGKTLLPAFVECHTHTLFGGSRADEFEMRNQGATYQQIAEKGGGIRSTVTKTRKLTEKELVKLGEKRLQEFLNQGVTTVEIKSGYGLDLNSEKKLLSAVKKLNRKPFRTVTTYLGPHALPENHTSVDSYIDDIIKNHLPKISKLAQRGDIFADNGYFSLKNLRAYANALKNMGWDLVVHADQLMRTGATELGVQLGARSVDHVLKINSQDIEALSKSDTTAVLLPAADFYLKINYPPARALIDAGARVALATDYNPGSSPTQNVSFVGVLARLQMKMSLPEVIVAYTLGAAYALNLQNELGSLEVGKAADFIAIDSNWQELFYEVGPLPISQVWSNGSKVVDKI